MKTIESGDQQLPIEEHEIEDRQNFKQHTRTLPVIISNVIYRSKGNVTVGLEHIQLNFYPS